MQQLLNQRRVAAVITKYLRAIAAIAAIAEPTRVVAVMTLLLQFDY